MFKRFVHNFVSTGMEIAYHVYVKHFENISAYKEKKNESIIYAANHSNALFDAFSVIFSQRKIIVFLTRAGVFGSKFANFWLDIFHMLPIYRQMDGIRLMHKNDAIMAKCVEILHEGIHPIGIFPEGNHNMKLGIRPLKKGITRIAFDTLDKYPDLDLKIIPIGINYGNPMKFRANVLVLKGPPISIKPYYDIFKENNREGVKKLLDDLSIEMQKLSLKIPNDRYDEIHKLYREYRIHGNNLLQNFENDKQLIQDLIEGKIPSEVPKNKSNRLLMLNMRRILTLPIGIIAWISNLIPMFIVRVLLKKLVNDPHFIDSIRFAFSAFLFPILYFIQALVLYLIIGNFAIALSYFILIPFLSKFYFNYLYKIN